MVIGYTPLLLENCGISYHWTSGYHRQLLYVVFFKKTTFHTIQANNKNYKSKRIRKQIYLKLSFKSFN